MYFSRSYSGYRDPLYLSFKTSLSYYHLIPESVYGISAASTCRTYSFKITLTEFKYKTIKSALFFGYDLVNDNNKYIKYSQYWKGYPELLLSQPAYKKRSDFASLRINRDIFLNRLMKKECMNLLKDSKRRH